MNPRFAIMLVPLAAGLGALPLIDDTNLIMRPLLAITILAGFLSLREGPQSGEAGWLGLLLFYGCSFGLSSVYSAAPDLAMSNVGRQAFIMVFAFATLMLFRDEEVRLRGLRACVVLMLAVFSATIWVYLELFPTYGFSYEAARLIKAVAFEDYHIGLNTLSYLAVIGLLAFWMFFKGSRTTVIAVSCAVFLCAFALGSRATVLALGMAWLIVLVFRNMWRVSPALGLLSIPLILGLGALGWMMLADYAVEIRDLLGAEVLREISVGRTDLWGAGLDMLAQRPLVGWGPESWKILLLEFLPSSNEHTLNIIMNLTSGSFHNGFITVAAERGGIGLLSATAMQAYLFWCASHVYARRALFSEWEQRAASLAPVLVLFMFLHGLAESSGLFGNGNSEVDYLAYFFASYVVALHAAGIRLERELGAVVEDDEADETAALPSVPA